MEKLPCVYIMTNRFHESMYVGVTSNLHKRVWQHRQHAVRGFTKKYNLTRLAFYEVHDDMYEAICREKAIKKWSRAWKIELIEEKNPTWKDLWFEILGG